jgi:hypothetical protein
MIINIKLDPEAVLYDLQRRIRALQEDRQLTAFCRDYSPRDYVWCRKLVSGDIPNPGIRTVDRVASALDRWEEDHYLLRGE